jgi:hypothetical protein
MRPRLLGCFGLARGEMFLQELQAPQACVAPDCLVLEAVAGCGIDFYFLGDSFLLEQLLQMVGFFDGDGGIGLAVKDEHGT